MENIFSQMIKTAILKATYGKVLLLVLTSCTSCGSAFSDLSLASVKVARTLLPTSLKKMPRPICGFNFSTWHQNLQSILSKVFSKLIFRVPVENSNEGRCEEFGSEDFTSKHFTSFWVLHSLHIRCAKGLKYTHKVLSALFQLDGSDFGWKWWHDPGELEADKLNLTQAIQTTSKSVGTSAQSCQGFRIPLSCHL